MLERGASHEATVEERQASRGRTRTNACIGLAASGLLTVVWFTLARRFGHGDVYAVIGPFACIVSASVIALYRRALAPALRPSTRGIVSGIVLGSAMTALTYPVFQLAVLIWPELEANVEQLYAAARNTTLPRALIWASAAAIAEELLFRGMLLDSLSRLMQPWMAAALSVVIYALAQLGAGSFIIFLMALGYGSAWTLQRRLTGSLLSTLISHLIWTPTTLVLFPVI
jgi:membrane protease YdiL (CAAX protease family)